MNWRPNKQKDTFFSDNDISCIDAETLLWLKTLAVASPLKRARLCLHKDTQEQVQQMIIALHSDTLFRPHRHPSGKSESIQIIEGKLKTFYFDQSGNVLQTITLSECIGEAAMIYRMSGGQWHLPLNLTEWVVFHEIFTGPYDKTADVEYAHFAPAQENPVELRKYCQQLLVSDKHD
jgi:cupin fold WbuC family metalloprotein